MTDITVTQKDRDAAAPYMGFAFDRVKRGECDDSGLVQAFARHRQSSTEEVERASGEPPEITYEVWEDDLLVATSTSEKEARHYYAVRSQDGPVHLVKATTYRTALTRAEPHE